MGLVKRSDRLAFYGVRNGEAETFCRMTRFTEISFSKNAKSYSRRYIDEDFEQSDVVGYAPAVSYAFDRYTGNAVHTDIAKIHDDELLGEAAVRSIVMVDMTDGEGGTFAARRRDFAVIPDSEGDGTDAYAYSGRLRAKSAVCAGRAASTDDWLTCVFTEA